MAKQKIRIPLSEEDIQELANGETFDWSFPDQNGVWVDVELFVGEDEE